MLPRASKGFYERVVDTNIQLKSLNIFFIQIIKWNSPTKAFTFIEKTIFTDEFLKTNFGFQHVKKKIMNYIYLSTLENNHRIFYKLFWITIKKLKENSIYLNYILARSLLYAAV